MGTKPSGHSPRGLGPVHTCFVGGETPARLDDGNQLPKLHGFPQIDVSEQVIVANQCKIRLIDEATDGIAHEHGHVGVRTQLRDALPNVVFGEVLRQLMGNLPLLIEEVIPNERALRPPVGCALHGVSAPLGYFLMRQSTALRSRWPVFQFGDALAMGLDLRTVMGHPLGQPDRVTVTYDVPEPRIRADES